MKGVSSVIRVLIADDHQLVRDGLRGILATASGIEVTAEAANGDETLALVRARPFDVALLDMSMPGLAGIDLIKRLKIERPQLHILVLSMHGEQQYAARALKAGAAGYLTKDAASEQLVSALRKVAAGGRGDQRCGRGEPAGERTRRRRAAAHPAVGPRVRSFPPARGGPDTDRNCRSAAPVGEDRQHP